MLFMVQMKVNPPSHLTKEEFDDVKVAEKNRALDIQRKGKWPHLWRVTGKYSNVSIFDVESNQELHELLSSLPLFPYMDIEVTPLNEHPSALKD
ncbi:muconolactone delta-isomerase [Marinobacter fuscus]|uniref:Muconolactone Delta-isomerase n=1 Tax=Marinobacter fuscus TaxID=2109942 RepID=A0A2T1KPH6_9GAMM|nr:muconolactone Delta-isomerase [Marinobacter fuscus]PSF11938.1 muconolactone delta-isomerase [Marinobacter fuscus]